MSSLVQRKFVDPLKALLLQGITPRKLALSLACGIVLGVFPILGTTTILCALLALLLRLNMPAIQLVNYAIYPLHLALLLPFIRTGQWITGMERTNMSLDEIVNLVKTDHLRAAHLLWRMVLQGVVGWAMVTAIVFPLLYWLLFRAIDKIDRHLQKRRSASTLA